MKRVFKFSSFIVLAAMLLGLAGCSVASTGSSSSSSQASSSSVSSSSPASTAVSTTGGFSLPYTTVPIMNPLLPASQSNMALWPLMYDCLAEQDTSYNPVMELASAVSCTGTTATVTLKSGVLFTDGTNLSASDVEYSLEFVLQHTESPYYARLSNISSVTSNGLTVTITLKFADPLFANMLDVPIIKKDSDKAGNAIGTGRYKYSKNGVNATLTLNTKWYKGAASKFKTIPLVNIPNSNAVISSLSIGIINYAYSDNGSGAAITTTNTQTTPVNLNRLVFIGVNSSKAHLDNPHFRRALSLSINRKLLVSQTFSNRALACALPFNPSWSQLSKPADKDISADFTSVASEMSLAGGTGGTATNFTLLVNQDNSVRTAAARYVASCFAKTGITVTVKAVPFADYSTLIQQKNFDMYIGELKLSNNMDISPLLVSGGTAAYGVIPNSSTLATFTGWRSGTKDIKSVASAFSEEMPFIPLCCRMGTTSYTRGLSGVTATDGDVFYNFEKWSYK